jgi:hypothetical protein
MVVKSSQSGKPWWYHGVNEDGYVIDLRGGNEGAIFQANQETSKHLLSTLTQFNSARPLTHHLWSHITYRDLSTLDIPARA